jgi:hypothetical protein
MLNLILKETNDTVSLMRSKFNITLLKSNFLGLKKTLIFLIINNI